MMIKRVDKNRWLIGVAAVGLIVLRVIMPKARLDQITLALFIIICLVILWPDLEKLSTVIRRLRVGGFEVELAQTVEELSEKAEKVEEDKSQLLEDISPEVSRRIAEAASNPRSALIMVGIEIEQAIKRLKREYDISGTGSTQRVLHEIVSTDRVSKEVIDLFEEFWHVRNEIIHGKGFNVPDSQIYKMYDVGVKILGLLSTQILRPEGIESSETFGIPKVEQEP